MSGASLPRGWAQATLPEIAGGRGLVVDGDWVETKDQDPSGTVRLTQLADIGDGVFRDRSDRWMNTDTVRRLNCTILQEGDVLIARMPDPLGRACVFPRRREACVTAVDVCVVRAPDVVQQWLMHFINSPRSRSDIAALQSGSTRKRISRANLCTIAIPVPPHAEQRRMVAEVEKQFTRLDAAVAALEAVQAKLKRARASVLKAAVEGRLVPTEAELARAEGRAYEPAPALLERMGAKAIEGEAQWLPRGWARTTLDALCEVVGGIAKNKKDTVGREVPYLRVANVQRGHLDLSVVKTIVAPEETIAELRLLPGDILLNEGGDRDKLGRGWVWEGQIPECIHQNHVFRARVRSSRIQPKYLSHFANSVGQSYLVGAGKQTTNLASISLSKIRKLPIDLPPTAEQHRIVAEVDRRVSVLDTLGRSVNANLICCARLRQSILKRAFEGRLVPQDPTDEPATELLECIRGRVTAEATA